MYIFKNAWRNVTRCKGRNLLIGAILTAILLCTTIALSIHEAGTNLVESYRNQNALRVSIENSRMRGHEKGQENDESSNENEVLSLEKIQNFGDSSFVKDYYYIEEAALSSNDISAVSNENSDDEAVENNHFQGKREGIASMGDFRITAYSNFSYLDDFTTGKKKIVEGEMISGNASEKEIVISKALQEANNLELASEITFYLPDDEEKTYTFKIIGIYEIEEASEENNFLKMNALNEDNQIYANVSTLNELLENTENERMNTLKSYFYLHNNDDLEAFEKEIREKGLSDNYSLFTNESEILETLRPIQNIASFSFNFLIVILIIGGSILAILNFLLIRERKYEIGVLRAIGMSKKMITCELIIEMLIISGFALVIGTGIGFFISQPVTNQLLQSEITSYETKQENIKENFGKEGFERPSEQIGGRGDNKLPTQQEKQQNKMGVNNVDFVDNLKVSLSPVTILLLIGVTLLLSMISVASASIFINQYNPNKILQSR